MLKDHYRYAKMFKMIAVGVPKEAAWHAVHTRLDVSDQMEPLQGVFLDVLKELESEPGGVPLWHLRLANPGAWWGEMWPKDGIVLTRLRSDSADDAI